ncbi:MAG: thermonuclease family protein [Cyclobacteriaceae bacterium]|nr:thermonuclease family protein [Cyclobacteriaceae bacterium]MDH4296293.1 thermonuclease family protein [Cyclobacteriaceae bacterium]MDH5248647.1 thermonuclease family protein [Cyclobacteriaceae bacterium]
MKKLLFSALAIMMLLSVTTDKVIKGKVVKVIDGNTFQVKGEDKQMHKILLMGIDSPELEQEFGREAKKFLEKLILGKTVTLDFKGTDRFGNPLVDVRIDGTKDPRIELLKEGLAWTTENNPPANLEQYRSSAQLRNKGLWQQRNPIPPWIFRKEKGDLQQESI